MKKYEWNFCSNSAHVPMEFAGKDVNHVKAGPDSDNGKYRILQASSADASPSCIKSRLMCSMVLVSSWPENLVKSVGASPLEEAPLGYTTLDKETCMHKTGSLVSSQTNFASCPPSFA